MNPLSIHGVGILGPGFAGWPASRQILANEQPYRYDVPAEPRPEILPPNERRRGARSVRWALAVAHEALAASSLPASGTASVFASSSGDGQTLHEICEQLATAAVELSPTRFHNSVHNAAAGYWSIASGSKRNSVTLCGHDASFGAGLLEAAALVEGGEEAVLLVAYDLPYPEPLLSVRPIRQPLAIALVLCGEGRGDALAHWKLSLSNESATPSPGVWPEALDANPAAAGLPLLAAIAQRAGRAVRLALGPSQSLRVECSA